MIVPYAHLASPTDAPAGQIAEMMELSNRAIVALRKLYRAEGFNIGMNLGHSAGAGVREHFHLHVVPRWIGDANYISIVGETRVLPEELKTTCMRLKNEF
jgi:ATP adenylyltransferase